MYRKRMIGRDRAQQGSGKSQLVAATAVGYLSEVTYPNGDTLQALTWDHNGNVLTAQNGRGQTFTSTYNDNESRLPQTQSADVDNGYAYDVYGRQPCEGNIIL